MGHNILFLLIALFNYTSVAGQVPADITGYKYYEKTDNGWNLMSKEDFQYNKHAKLTESTSWEMRDGKWIEKGRTTYEFPGDTLRLEIKTEFENGKPITFRNRYVLDNKGKETGVTFEDFDSLSGKWVANVRGLYLKDAENHVVEIKYLRNKDGQWHEEDRNLFGYDQDGNESWDIFQVLENEIWVSHQKSIHHYDKTNVLTSTEIYYQDKSSSIPGTLKSKPDTRFMNTYDNRGRILERLIQNNKDGKWVDGFKRESVYQKIKMQ